MGDMEQGRQADCWTIRNEINNIPNIYLVSGARHQV